MEGSLQIGPKLIVPVDAVCSRNSQLPNLNVERIRVNYGKAYLPAQIEICNCENDDAWYRFRETDDLSNFQIEVDGRHNDQNSPTTGYRPAFKLNQFGEEGGCQVFKLTYRTSASRPYSDSTSSTGPVSNNQYHSISIDIVLQRFNGTSAAPPAQNAPGWVTVPNGTFNVTGGKVWRTVRNSTDNSGDPINFNRCSVQNGGRNSLAGAATPVTLEPSRTQRTTSGD